MGGWLVITSPKIWRFTLLVMSAGGASDLLLHYSAMVAAIQSDKIAKTLLQNAKLGDHTKSNFFLDN